MDASKKREEAPESRPNSANSRYSRNSLQNYTIPRLIFPPSLQSNDSQDTFAPSAQDTSISFTGDTSLSTILSRGDTGSFYSERTLNHADSQSSLSPSSHLNNCHLRNLLHPSKPTFALPSSSLSSEITLVGRGNDIEKQFKKYNEKPLPPPPPPPPVYRVVRGVGACAGLCCICLAFTISTLFLMIMILSTNANFVNWPHMFPLPPSKETQTATR